MQLMPWQDQSMSPVEHDCTATNFIGCSHSLCNWRCFWFNKYLNAKSFSIITSCMGSELQLNNVKCWISQFRTYCLKDAEDGEALHEAHRDPESFRN